MERRVLAAMVEVQMTVHHRRYLTDLEAHTFEEFRKAGTLWFIEIIDELVTEANAGVDEDRAVRVQDAEPVVGNPRPECCGRMGGGEADHGKIETHDRRHLSESGHL